MESMSRDPRPTSANRGNEWAGLDHYRHASWLLSPPADHLPVGDEAARATAHATLALVALLAELRADIRDLVRGAR